MSLVCYALHMILLRYMFLKQIKLSDLKQEKKYHILVPIGSTEQHGPYLPFGSDTYMTDAVVKEIDRQFPNILVLPTLEYSCSGEHEGFMGTVWLEEKTFKLVLLDVCHSVKEFASSIIFFTEHGGNLNVIDEFITDQNRNIQQVPLYHLETDNTAIDEMAKKIMNGPVDVHAGNSEISLLLSLEPTLVTIPNKHDTKTPVENPWETRKLKDKSRDGIADLHPEWLVSKEFGERIFQVMKDTTIQNLKKILKEQEGAV